MAADAAREARPSRPRFAALAFLALALVAWLAWRSLLPLELLGWDSYPLILTGRIQSWSDFTGTFSELLMDGRYPIGRFYRPVTHLAFAFDHALWGIEPSGYHRSDLAILVACAFACGALALRLLGPRALLGAALAALVYALHPIQFEILPAAPRRAESLSVLFTLVALWLAASGASAPSVPRRALAAFACWLAIAAKETGVIAPALVFALVFLRGERGLKERFSSALRASWPAFVLVALHIVARTAVVGGLGGNSRSDPTSTLQEAPATALRYARAVLFPSPIAGVDVRADFAVIAVGIVLAALLAVLALVGRRAEGSASTRSSAALFLAAWFALDVLITGVSGVDRGWYTLPFLPVYALALGSIAQRGWEEVRGGRRAIGATALGAALLLAATHVAACGLFDRAPELHAASSIQRSFLSRFEDEVRRAPPGARLEIGGLPSEMQGRREGAIMLKVLMLGSYSLESYAELVFPEKLVRVEVVDRESDRAPRAGEVLVLLVPGAAKPR